MFKKILIANRGEIACRIIRTAKGMGIATVAVYSDADRDALHVRDADEALNIGAAPSAKSYLSIDNIIEAARRTGADAVHPGYGFLSENPRFAEALKGQGIAFIGPPIAAIEAMGDKIESKKIAAGAGVATVPGHIGVIADADEAVKVAAEIGYPVMIKASAGGGGKGMRIAWNEIEARDGFASSKSEAKSSFGDDRIFIEKFITDPRHIEIQLLGDAHGNLIHLNERECSIQRRNQKVIEESPSPFIDAATRARMGEQAIALGRAVGYQSAGTVEFIVDAKRNFYFLEMNTRLQVEHPVTELVTGIDLVEEMIRIAAGEKLRFTQAEIPLNGWAIEARVYAEDPYRGFLPSTGRLTRYRPPLPSPSIRNDTGVFEGGEISVHYDPMIAKLCTFAPDRAQAIEGLAEALDDFEIEGIGHNLPFLAAVMRHPRFRDGHLTTSFIAEEYPKGFAGVAPSKDDAQLLAAVAAVVNIRVQRRNAQISGTLANHPRKVGAGWVVTFDGFTFPVRFTTDEQVSIGDGMLAVVSDWRPGANHAVFTVGAVRMGVKVSATASGWRLRWRGIDVLVHVRSPRIAELARLLPAKLPPDTSRLLLCPMPGVVMAIWAAEGDTVEVGQALATVEAMKMENVLRAERQAVVARIAVKPGATLAVDDLIMEFEPLRS